MPASFRSTKIPPVPAPTSAPQPQSETTGAPATAETETRPRRVPRTRAGMAWVAIGTAAVLAIALIIFVAQNTRSTEITFLWMTASTPLAVALLIAAVGSVLLTLIIGTARIAQLRHLIRKSRD
jgi:uncharacterized integral membrane protein